VLAGVKAKGGISSYLFFKAFNSKKAYLDKTVHHWLWDRLVFGQVSVNKKKGDGVCAAID
jgi:long-chain acyl-CoA synthetase